MRRGGHDAPGSHDPQPTVTPDTLDAIHLATAMPWRKASVEELVLATHDRSLALAARACGLPTIGA